MSDEDKNNKSEEITLIKNETNPNEIFNIITPVIQPLMDTLTKPQIKQIEENSKLAHKNLEYQHSHFNMIFWFIVFISVIILFISLYLIIYKNNISEGISVLSYAGAIAMGFIGGYGYAKKS
ncbi:MAG: hypothetical protein M1273_08320 [Deltaproteobacteria bacterium]|jgi:hypothetical protein|nr:hypothetical protein [Deltaproteobacteria bacterium]